MLRTRARSSVPPPSWHRVWCTRTDHHTYGTSTHTVGELAPLVSDCLGLVFTEHDSDYRGVYQLASSPDGRIEIQPNPIPDGDGDNLYAPEHPTARVLLLTTSMDPDPDLQARLGSIEGLIHLNHEIA
ncbi:hypothetical protein ACIHEJ_34770 [Streptomyces sp. NPDC052301]|uniref:hypothetical protein n=1 Tax=Streptomyces sp. NPDC052301 TaxID=3365687 RepID=UPI0037D1E0B8